MNPSDWIMVAAVLLAPLVALQVQRYLDNRREKRHRRTAIFQTLMTTRAQATSPAHVHALNLIDIEFYGKGSVIQKWKEYHDHLGSNQNAAWGQRREDLFIELLYQMAKSLGYKFDKLQLKRSIYFPVAHSDLEAELGAIRRGLIEVLAGKRPLLMKTTSKGKQSAQQTSMGGAPALPPSV